MTLTNATLSGELLGRRVLVTGAGSGIGLATVALGWRDEPDSAVAVLIVACTEPASL